MNKLNGSKLEITISNRTILRILAFIVAAGVVIQIFENMIHPLTLIFVSFFLAISLNQAVSWVAGKLKSKKRGLATAISYIVVITFFIGLFSAVIPPLVSQTQDFIEEIPQTISDLQTDDGVLGNLVRDLELDDVLDEVANDWSGIISRSQGPVVSTASRVVSNLLSIITVLVLTFMMLVEGPRWVNAFWRQYPKDKRKHAQGIADKMYNVVKNYVNGQVLVAAIGATFSVIGLFILSSIFNVEGVNPIALGGIVFLFSLIPTVGAILSAIVIVTFCMLVSIPLALSMLVYFVIYQQIENVSIQPMVQSRGNNLTPMLVFIAAIVGIGFGGVLGAFISIPLAGCIRVLFDDYQERNK